MQGLPVALILDRHSANDETNTWGASRPLKTVDPVNPVTICGDLVAYGSIADESHGRDLQGQNQRETECD